MTSTVAATSPVETGLRQDVLTLPDALAQSVTVLAPALSGGFITYLAAVKAGGATPLSFALATVVCLLIGGVVSGFARTIRSAGSLYTYTIHGLPANTSFQLWFWNHEGDSLNSFDGRVHSGADRAVTVEAPLQSVFVLTTLSAS